MSRTSMVFGAVAISLIACAPQSAPGQVWDVEESSETNDSAEEVDDTKTREEWAKESREILPNDVTVHYLLRPDPQRTDADFAGIYHQLGISVAMPKIDGLSTRENLEAVRYVEIPKEILPMPGRHVFEFTAGVSPLQVWQLETEWGIVHVAAHHRKLVLGYFPTDVPETPETSGFARPIPTYETKIIDVNDPEKEFDDIIIQVWTRGKTYSIPMNRQFAHSGPRSVEFVGR